MTKFVLLIATLLALPISSSDAQSTSLFAQSAGEVLKREFSSPAISFLLLDAGSGRVLASDWDNPDAPVPVGSLIKPFVALAYGEQHGFNYPTHICRGTSSGCWFPRGHGQVGLTSAIAYSCNSYFRKLTAGLTGDEITPTMAQFGLQAPPATLTGLALAGMGNQWQVSPLRLARAYLELERRADQPGVRQVLAGMKESAQQGTGAGVDRALSRTAALAKTGTAPCSHRDRAVGDGFAVALAPASQPRVLLIVRVHGVPGFTAANVAGQMLRRIEE